MKKERLTGLNTFAQNEEVEKSAIRVTKAKFEGNISKTHHRRGNTQSQNLNNKDIYSTSNYELLESKSQSISPSVNNENSTKDESQHCNDGELYGEESHNLLRSVHKKYTLIAVRSEEFGRE
ncbi:hypothetical protein RclHR1_09030006 [Rhizophagus clarus]|uniref:Uncharacterized protein n=1 Tax=Rhizophagus clarus TaxID=94130 RepID=A0A2Z6S314_9GLOM|nr:hypothetical protein RclHR1_09030006 [Rhizophagus clarus]